MRGNKRVNLKGNVVSDDLREFLRYLEDRMLQVISKGF